MDSLRSHVNKAAMLRIQRAICVFVVLAFCAQVSWAQQQLSGLKDPLSVAVQQSTGETFIYERGGNRLLRWNGNAAKPATGILAEQPAGLSVIVAAEMRDTNSLSLIGYADKDLKTPRIATFKVDPSGSVTIDPNLSADLLLETAKPSITAVTSTPLAIYIATRDGARSQIWKLPTYSTTLAKVRALRQQPALITAMAINAQGHLVFATQTDDDCRLEFAHTESGQRLMSLRTDLRAIDSLSYQMKTGLLYATGNDEGRQGVFRLEATFAGNRQEVRAVEVLSIKRATQIDCSPQRDLVLVGGKDDGRLVTVDLSPE